MTPRKPAGYTINREVSRAINANRAARRSLQRIIDETPGPTALMMLVAKTAAALGENLDALQEIGKILEETKPRRKARDDPKNDKDA